MALKFYLNKFLKVDNIEHYSLSQLLGLKDAYQEFIDESEGHDPDFPMTTFGSKGTKVSGTNIHTITKPTDFEEPEDTKPKAPQKKSDDVNVRALEFLKNMGLKN